MRLSRPLLVLALGAAAGCSAPVVDDVADANGSTTQGVVLVERVATEGALQTNVSAKFMRLAAAADPEDAERVVGSHLELPAAGECVVLHPFGDSSDEVESSVAAVGSIELIDVGDVTLRWTEAAGSDAQPGQSSMSLATRAFPDVGALVSGVFYTSRDAATELPAPARYVIESSGSAGLERFAVDAEAPPAPEEATVAGVALDQPLSVAEGTEMPVRWRAGSQTTDLVYLDVVAPATGATARCAFNDTGEGSLPGDLLRTETIGSLPTTVSVSLYRLRVASVGASSQGGEPRGIDVGEVRFQLGVAGRLVVEPAPAGR
jgi:hypothetical protein